MTKSALSTMIDYIDSLDPAAGEGAARFCLLDALGCILYGSTLADGAAIIRGVSAFGSGSVPLPMRPGEEVSLTPDNCALVMGALCHLRELDDVHAAIIHPGACVAPAAWSAAHALDRTLGDLLDAVFAGYEASCRISEASGYLAHRARGWHATATFGPFGAAMAAARLLGFGPEATVWALGIAGTRTGGSWAFAADGAMTKRLHPGMAARDGLQAAFLAKAGISGPAYILEAEDGGLYTLMSDGADLGALAKPWAIPAVSATECKYYASCKSVHSPFEAAAAIYRRRARDAAAGGTGRGVAVRGEAAPADTAPGAKPAAVKVYVNESAMHMAGRMYARGSVASAQLSIPYGVALALTGRTGSAGDYREEAVADRTLFDLASLVEVEVSAEMDALRHEDATSSAVVEVTWKDGGVSREFVKAAKGSAENPLTEGERLEKFIALAGACLGRDGAGRLADRIMEAGRNVRVRTLLTQ